jgi:hypothetical protein
MKSYLFQISLIGLSIINCLAQDVYSLISVQDGRSPVLRRI